MFTMWHRILLWGLLALTRCRAALVKPKDWKKYYTRIPQSNNPENYVLSTFNCRGKYALCAFGTCVKVKGSEPPVAECGCYSYASKSLNIGAIVGVLDGQLKDEMKKKCKQRNGKPLCEYPVLNTSPFCKAMNRGTVYKGARPDYISTWNPTYWDKTTGQPESPVQCDNGGTWANCFSAACYAGAPKSPYLKGIGAPTFNATCYCPYYTTSKGSFNVWNATADPCGPNAEKDVKDGTLIYNGV